MTYDLNITFDDNLVTGNETIDTQHKELIDRIQNFVTACQNGDSKDVYKRQGLYLPYFD